MLVRATNICGEWMYFDPARVELVELEPWLSSKEEAIRHFDDIECGDGIWRR